VVDALRDVRQSTFKELADNWITHG
jgi:hypothetical protein